MIDLTVKTLDSQNHSFSLDDDITVRGFKEYIAESVAVPADCQRLIYCGRVLQDEKKLNDYDVNGKVIHLVQRAPPQPGQRGNSGGQSQNNGQNNSQNTGRTHRTHYRIIRDAQNAHAGPNAQVHGNAMYLGAMTLPTEVVEGHGLPVPQLSNTLSNSRMVMAKRMLINANRIMDRLENPNSSEPENSGTERPQSSSPLDSTDPMDTSRSEPSQGESVGSAFMSQDEAIEVESGLFQSSRVPQRDFCVSNRETRRMENALRVAVADVLSTSRLQNVTSSPAEDDTDIHEVEVSTSNDTQSETAPQPQQPRESSSSEEPRSSERPRTTPTLPRPPQMAELLEMLMVTQDRLRPYLERYRALMATDPVLSPTGIGAESVAENQHIVDEVSRILHYISHANHALSDIIVDMGQAPPRNLSCRPIIIQQSAILQAGIPIQLEAHISLHGRNAHSNSTSTEENSSAPTATEAGAGAEARETPTEERAQQQNSSSSNQQPRSDQQQRPDQQQQQSQTPFGSMFNLPSNVEVLMEVSPDSSMDLNSSDDQSPGNGANANNNAGGNMGRGASGMFPWGAAPPTDFIRNLMHAVAGHIVQDPVGMTSNQSSNAATVTISQQTIGVTIDSNGQNSGQSTQARNNVGTHPTTSTQTRSTSRPHVFHSHGVGLGQGLCADPFLPCNSHHLRRTPTTSGNASRQSTTSRNQAGPQASASSSAANSTTNASSTPWIVDGDSYLGDLRDGLGNRRFRPHRAGLAHSLRNLVRTLSKGKVDVRYSGDVPASTSSITLAELLETREEGTNSLSTHVFGWEGNFLVDLSVLFAQNVTLEGFVGLRFGHYGAISSLRRPFRELVQHSFPQAAPSTVLQNLFVDGLINCLRPHSENILPGEKDASNRSIAWVDVVRTVEGLFRRHFTGLLKRLFSEDLDDATFGQEAISVLGNLGTEVCNVLRHLVVGGQVGLLGVIQRFVTAVAEDVHPNLRRWALSTFMTQFRVYTTQVSQLSNSEIIPLLVFDTPTRSVVSESSESSDSDQEFTPTAFSGQEMLPPDWVPVIARDGVRQRRQAQGISSGGVPTFSDAYLGCLPCKRRKIIQQEKPQILVNPTSNHSTITASIERLVRESVSRAGVAEVEGASVAVANDLGVRTAFGQAIRDCLQPQRYRTPDFPDPSRFPNATKFFHQDRPPKQ